MEKKITEMEKKTKDVTEKRDFTVAKKKEIEEKLRQSIAKEIKVYSTRRLLMYQRLMLEKFVNRANNDAPDASQVAAAASPEPDSPDGLTDNMKQLAQDLKEYKQFMQNAKEKVGEMRSALPEQRAKVEDLQAKCDLMEKTIQEMTCNSQKQRHDLGVKMIALKAEKKALDEKVFSISTEIQKSKTRYAALQKQKQSLKEKYDRFIAEFQTTSEEK